MYNYVTMTIAKKKTKKKKTKKKQKKKMTIAAGYRRTVDYRTVKSGRL